MRGIRTTLRRMSLLAMVPLLTLPLSLGGQTTGSSAAAEARIREIREQLRAVHERQSEAVREARAQYREQLARLEEQLRESRGQEREELRALREHELQERIQRQAQRVRELSGVREHQLQEALEGREALMEGAFLRAREAAERAQQVVIRMGAGIRLGVSLDVNQAEEYDSQGVLLSGVMDDSPAEEAGLREGDIITHLNGHDLLAPIPDEDEMDFDEDDSLPVLRLMALARELDEGDEVTVEYLRDGEAASVSFQPAEVEVPFVWVGPEGARNLSGVFRFDPESRRSWSYRRPREGQYELYSPNIEVWRDMDLEDIFEDIHVEGWEPGNFRTFSIHEGDEPFSVRVFGAAGRFGLELAELNPDLASYFSTDQGVLVLEVDEDSELGLRAGDVILRIGDRDVEDRGDVGRILSSYEDDETVTFTVMREGRETTVQGTTG